MVDEKKAAQSAVIGSMLLDSPRLSKLWVKFGVKVAWFEEQWQPIVITIVEMWDKNTPVDLTAVIDKMRVDGTLDKAGGAATLERFIDETPTSAHAEHYMLLLRSEGIRIATVAVLRGMAKRINGESESPEMVVQGAPDVLRSILDDFSIEEEEHEHRGRNRQTLKNAVDKKKKV